METPRSGASVCQVGVAFGLEDEIEPSHGRVRCVGGPEVCERTPLVSHLCGRAVKPPRQRRRAQGPRRRLGGSRRGSPRPCTCAPVGEPTCQTRRLYPMVLRSLAGRPSAAVRARRKMGPGCGRKSAHPQERIRRRRPESKRRWRSCTRQAAVTAGVPPHQPLLKAGYAAVHLLDARRDVVVRGLDAASVRLLLEATQRCTRVRATSATATMSRTVTRPDAQAAKTAAAVSLKGQADALA